jgi:hypothetical protein
MMKIEPSKSDELNEAEAQSKFVEAIEAGNTRRIARMAAGITPATLREWCRCGAAGEQPYADFLARIEKAESNLEERALSVVRNAALGGDSEAAAFLLGHLERHRGT